MAQSERQEPRANDASISRRVLLLPCQATTQAHPPAWELECANQSRALPWCLQTIRKDSGLIQGRPHASDVPTRELGTLESLFWSPDDCLWMGEMGFSWSTRFSVSPPKPSAMPLVSEIVFQSTRNSHALRCTRLSNTAVHTAATLGPLYCAKMSQRSQHTQRYCILDTRCHLISEPGYLKLWSAATADIDCASRWLHARNELPQNWESLRDFGKRICHSMPHNGSPGEFEARSGSFPESKGECADGFKVCRNPCLSHWELGGCIRPGEQVSDSPSAKLYA